MKKKLSLKELNLAQKKALIRVDFNVPLNCSQIRDDTRIKASLPTIEYVLSQGGAAILMSHLGRPKGGYLEEFSLDPCAKRLAELLHRPVQMAPSCRGAEVEKMAAELKPGQILMLENLRFHLGEQEPSKDPSFASSLACLGDLYINDTFSSTHRRHASITQITQFFFGCSAMGLLIEKELSYLTPLLNHPKRPFYAILGGAKISTKIKIIKALIEQADVLLIGGAMAYTFLKAQGKEIGSSLVEKDCLPFACQLIKQAKESNCSLILPLDHVITNSSYSVKEAYTVTTEEGILQGFQGVDIGRATIEKYEEKLQQAQTVFWNGPLGVFEKQPFDYGTNALAKVLAALKAVTVIGGGDSVAAVECLGKSMDFTYLSTGGGAVLELIEHKQLPGIQALSDSPSFLS